MQDLSNVLFYNALGSDFNKMLRSTKIYKILPDYPVRFSITEQGGYLKSLVSQARRLC